MRVLKSKDAILKAMPKLSEEDVEKINKCFTPYLFFTNYRKEQVRECWCSRCHAHFYYDWYQRTQTEEHYNFISAKHNEWTKCPECGADVMAKNTGKVKCCANLSEWKRIICIKPKGYNTVYLECIYAYKEYSSSKPYNLAEPEYNISTVYYLTPGYVREFKKAYDYMYLGLKNNEFYEPKSITEPFIKTYWYNISAWEKRGHNIIGLDRLKKTFCQYVDFDSFDKAYEACFYQTKYYRSYGEGPEIKFLAYSALYPSVERLMKCGLSEFVCKLVDNKPMKRYIDWNAPTPKLMFGMCSDEFSEFRNNFYGEEDFKVYQNLRKIKPGIKYSKAVEIVKKFGGEASARLTQTVKTHNLNLTHTLNYLEKHTESSKAKALSSEDYSRTAIMWTDYIHFAKELKYDLKRDDVIFPKRLQQAHDSASEAVVISRDEKKAEKYKKRKEKLEKMYAYSDGIYEIVIPTGVNDIIQEGKVLGHCVGGYAERHVRGATTILFMRLCENPSKRYITIEVSDSKRRICQNYGKKNRLLKPEEKEFVDKWIAWVQAGSKRKKNKKDAKAA